MRHLYVIACDICHGHRTDLVRPTERGARRAARRAGWRKHGRTRKCPTCAATPAPADNQHARTPR